ncbi:MAG: biopolymer transporter ExbD [Cryobacterium sp.]|nr:biopolymer transporter ExbD [Oligoflexia bacterium]
MLVLLIVFMISAPLMQQGIQVDLPKANAPTLNEIPDQLVLVVDKAKRVLINGNAVASGSLRNRLVAMSKAKPEIQVFIQADQNIPYGFIAQVMAEVKQAGITRVGLVTEAQDSNSRL